MDKLIYSLIDNPQDNSLEKKICQSFENYELDGIKIDESSSFIQEVIKQAAYSVEEEKLNDEVGIIIAAWLKKKKRLNVVQWKPNNVNYPKFMLLGTDKGILAYIEFFYHCLDIEVDDTTVGHAGICHSMENLKIRLALVDSDLDRPVFYVHIIDYPNQKGVFFETTEMIKNNIFLNSKCVYSRSAGDLYFSDISEMGDFNELIYIFEDLKKNNVKFY